MTTETYDNRLRAFAEGKRLGRLAKAVRDPEDGSCDACGSTLPSTLFGLKDSTEGHHYFVGQNCLASLLEMGLVARGRYRQSAEKAYREEMEVRRNGAASSQHESRASDSLAGVRPPLARRSVCIIKTNADFEVVAHIDDGQRKVTGRARESRWRSAWARDDHGTVILERGQEPRPRALAIGVLRAYGRALSEWRQVDGRDGSVPDGTTKKDTIR